MGRLIRGRARVVTSVVCDPDAYSVQAASLGLASNTISPMSKGTPGRFNGDRGYGVNRWAGRTIGPVQHWAGAINPIVDPLSPRLGAGYGAAGQPGLPSTGDSNAGLLGFGQLAQLNMGA